MTDRTPFAAWLRQRRHLLDLTQAQLADRCGCSAITIRKLEAGERRPSQELAEAMLSALRIPARENNAFVQFARSDELDAPYQLPAWDPNATTWRSNQLPDRESRESTEPHNASIQYELTAQKGHKPLAISGGRHLIHVDVSGTVKGALEGAMQVHISQIINPKPASFDFSQSVPMQIAAKFTIQSGEELLQGSYSGSYTPMIDHQGNGTGRVQATGLVFFATAGLVEFLFNYVIVEETVKIVEGDGVGAQGTILFRPTSGVSQTHSCRLTNSC